MITAPFNFVPLSEDVFFPEWAEQVSHDIPFEDSQSGVIDVTITAKSPIFVRNHSDNKDNPSSQFCNYDGNYYLPGSSVKGMIRSVLENLSFSKMHKNYDDDTYAIRDLRDRDLYMDYMKPNQIHCGWLKKVNNEFFVEDCGVPGRIKHEDIDKLLDVSFAKNFKAGNFKNTDINKTAKSKYERLSGKRLDGYSFATNHGKDRDPRLFAVPADAGKTGHIVLTGQPSARKEPEGKKAAGKVFEFVFFESKGDINISKEVVKNLRFAYFEGKSNESEDWKWRKKQLAKGEKIPVFFHKNSDGKSVKHLGLSYLYKLPYKHSISGGIPDTHKTEKPDMSETIFGFIQDKEQLKGRVHFSHFRAEENATVLQERTEILGTPRASYYPIYIKQDGGKYATYMNGEFRLAGWKRYPVHKSSKVKITKVENAKMASTFQPLQEGSRFNGKIRYHNLKKAELGALLSALTFHNTDNCFHSVGMAKPLGYGKIELKINFSELNTYLKAFEICMEEQIANWSTSPQLVQLLTMVQEQKKSDDSVLEYITMSLHHNEFVQAKNDKDYLYPYTEYNGVEAAELTSLLSDADLEEIQIKQKAIKEAKILAEKEAEEARLEQIRIDEEKEQARKEAEKLKKQQEHEAKLEQERLDREAKKAEQQKEKDEKEKARQEAEDAKRSEQKAHKQALLDAGLSGLSSCSELKEGMNTIKQYRSSNNGNLTQDDKKQIAMFLCAQAKAQGCSKKFKKATKELVKWLDAGEYERLIQECCNS